MQIYVDHTGQVHFNATSLKRGDDLEFQLSFLNEKGLAVSCPYSSVKFGAKKTADYDGGFLVYLDSWSDSGNVKVGKVALNGTALAELLGSGEYVLIAGEFEFSTTEQKVTSQTVKLKIYNDLIKGAEGIPSGTIPNYATEEYINGVVTEKVADEIDSREDVLSGLVATATEKASEAQASANTASEKSVNANVSALTAQESALSASESLATVRALKSSVEGVSVKVAQNVALAAQKAENAATSATEALASKNAAQKVADSLGSEVAEAKQSATEAKASATSAATSAATAKTEVGKIGNSVAESQTAATNAAASATTASGHATTAGTKATQAATSATNAAASETKAKASETAAGTAATNAAASANTASGHASTASTKAMQAGTSASNAYDFATQSQASRIASEAAAGRSHTASKNSEASATQAETARDAAVTAKTAAEAAADRAEAASGGGVTDAQVNTKINTHNTSAAAHSGEFSKKLDNPTGGTTGQVLTKTASGTAWNNLDNGTPSSPTTYAYVDVTGILEVTGLFTPKGGVRTELTSPVSTAGGGNFGTNAALLDKDSPTKTPLLSLSLQKFGSETTPIPRLQVLYRPLEIVIPSDEANNKPLLSKGLLMMGYTEKFLTPLGEPGSHTHHVRWLDNPYHLVNVGMLRAMLDDHLQSIKSYVTDAILAAAPVGSIWPHWSNVIPDGFLLCNKGLVSKTTYARLYASRPTIGPGWGESGDKFYLPDLGARYPRGTNNGNVGVYLEDAIRNISGGIGLYGHSYAGLYSERVWGALEARSAGAEGAVRPVLNSTSGETSSGVTVEMILSANKQVPTAEENRPRTTVVNFIIKY